MQKKLTKRPIPKFKRSLKRLFGSKNRRDSENGVKDEEVAIVQSPANSMSAIVPSSNVEEYTRLHWTLPVNTFAPKHWVLLGLASSAPIHVVIDSQPPYGSLPRITIKQAGTNHLTWECTHDPDALPTKYSDVRFRIGIALMTAATHWTECYWRNFQARPLCKLFATLQARLNSYGEHCMLCDKALEVPDVKPTICDTYECIYRYVKLGLQTELHTFKDDWIVADLLISFAVAAGNAPAGREFAMPSIPLGVIGPGIRHGPMISDMLGKMPRVEYIRHGSIEDVAEHLRKVRCGASMTCAWLFRTTRAQIALLPESRRLVAMNTPYQFHVRTSRQSHDINHANGRPSHFAFHISPFGNWHNILRQGLLNLSGTPQSQSGNCSYGRGIYLSKNTSVCIDHIHRLNSVADGWGRSLFGLQPYCLAICEVAEGPGVKFPASAGRVIVAKDPRSVTLRYLFVYRDLKSMPVDVDTSLPEVERFCQLHSVDER